MMTDSERTVVLLPVRSFATGKSRLSEVLAPDLRRDLGLRCAEGVRRAAGHLPVVVMSDDPEVRAWAVSTGAETMHDAGWDLNSSLTAAVRTLRERGLSRVVVAHADLPLADDLTWIETHRDVVIVPDRRADGTNVLAVPTNADFRFTYGLASSHHHDGEALRLGLEATIVRDPLLAWDIDVPDDLQLPEGDELAELQRASLKVRGDAAARAAAHG